MFFTLFGIRSGGGGGAPIRLVHTLLMQGFHPRSRTVKTHSYFLFFLVEPLVSASAGATRLLYGIVRGLLVWISRVCGGYEVDIYLLCSPYPRCFVALFSPLFGAF